MPPSFDNAHTYLAFASELFLVTEQKAVNFMARPTGTVTYSAGDAVHFDRVINNHGGAYNPDTAVFTATITGTYVFHVTIMAVDNGGNTRQRYVNLMKDSVAVEEIWTGIDNDHFVPGSGQAVLSLTVGQTVWVKNDRDHTQFYWPATSFSGALLHAVFP